MHLTLFCQAIKEHIGELSGVGGAIGLGAVYFYSIYLFAQMDAHATSFSLVAFHIAREHSISGELMAAIVAPFTSLCACTTTYSTGAFIAYVGAFNQEVSQQRWFGVGAMMSLFHLSVWFGLGLPYWKALGWY